MNKRLVVVGALAIVAVFAGVVYVGRDSAEEPVAGAAPRQQQQQEPVAPKAASQPPAPPGSRGSAAQRPVPPDPRLAALMVSPDDARIEFVADPEGRVIKEVDDDRASPSYRKPLREYTYAGTRVVRLVKYQYAGDQTQVVTADVIYQPDGGVGDVRESTRYEYAAQGKAGESLPR